MDPVSSSYYFNLNWYWVKTSIYEPECTAERLLTPAPALQYLTRPFITQKAYRFQWVSCEASFFLQGNIKGNINGCDGAVHWQVYSPHNMSGYNYILLYNDTDGPLVLKVEMICMKNWWWPQGKILYPGKCYHSASWSGQPSRPQDVKQSMIH